MYSCVIRLICLCGVCGLWFDDVLRVGLCLLCLCVRSFMCLCVLRVIYCGIVWFGFVSDVLFCLCS